MHYQRWQKYGDANILPEVEKRRIIVRTRTEKVCYKCEQLLPLTAFGPTTQESLDGLKGYCRECDAAYHKERFDENPEKVHATQRQWRQTNPGSFKASIARRRSRIQNLPCEDVNPITLADRDNWTCWICDYLIDKTIQWSDDWSINRWYRTIDHIVPLSRGGHHTYDNTRIAHWYCNVTRGADRNIRIELSPPTAA
jgi:5-methylcytosine-specific restriction endonuclease McrA